MLQLHSLSSSRRLVQVYSHKEAGAGDGGESGQVFCTSALLIWFVPVPLATASSGSQNQSVRRLHSFPAKGRDTDGVLRGPVTPSVSQCLKEKMLEETGTKGRWRSGLRKGTSTVMLGRK